MNAGIGETTLSQWFMWLAIIGIVLLLLIYGRPFLLPIVVAFLIFTVFSAAIDKVSRISLGGMKLPYWLAATAGLAVFAVALFLLYVVISGEILLIVAEWPRILERLQGLLASLSEWFGEDLGAAIRATQGEFNIIASIRGLVSPAGFAITAIIVVLLYVAFMFVESAHFAGKVSRLFPDPARESQVKDVARQVIKSVHRYLLMKTLLSAGNTLAAYALMKVIGLEFAETWALLTFFLNYIPKIGSITATVVPSVFALLQFQEWQPVLFVAGGLTLVHMVTGEIIEPMLMGRTLNLSSLVIMLALTFWAMVWGVVGTFLAVPLMVVILIICSKIPMLRPVAILLSSDGDLDDGVPQPAPKPVRRARRKAA